MNNIETIQTLQNDVAVIVSENTVPEVKDMDTYNKVGDVVKFLKNKYSAIEEKRKELTKPILDSKKQIDKEFKKTLDPLKDLITRATQAQKTFYIEEKARRDKEQEELEAKAIADGKDEVEIVNAIEKSHGDFASTTVSKKKMYRVVDETVIPREFLTVDDTKVKAHMKTNFNNPPKGIEYYYDEQLRHN